MAADGRAGNTESQHLVPGDTGANGSGSAKASESGSASLESRVAPLLRMPPGEWLPLGVVDGETSVETSVEVRDGEAVLRRGGRTLERRSVPSDLLGSTEWNSGYGAATLFEGYCFCYGDPKVYETVRVTVGRADEEEDFRRIVQPPERGSSLGGEIELRSQPDTEPLRGYWKEWPLDFLANLSGAREEYRRMVDINLPLGDDKADILIRYRLALLCCAAAERYIESRGEEFYMDAEGVHNGFGGGGLPLPRRSAPTLYGRLTDNIYSPHLQPTPPE